LAVLGRGLLDGLELDETGDDELAGSLGAELAVNDVGQAAENGVDGLLVDLGCLGQFGDDLGLGHALGCILLLGHRSASVVRRALARPVVVLTLAVGRAERHG
jgi:hypothetical protein